MQVSLERAQIVRHIDPAQVERMFVMSIEWRVPPTFIPPHSGIARAWRRDEVTARLHDFVVHTPLRGTPIAKAFGFANVPGGADKTERVVGQR